MGTATEQRRIMKKKTGKSVSLAALGILASGVLLAGCGQTRAVPADDSYAGGSEESSAPSSGSPSSKASKPSADPGKGSPRTLGPDTGTYADGTFTSVATYGPVSEDSIDVAVTVANQQVSDVKITPHPATPVSKKYQDGFVRQIKSAVAGRPLKSLKVDKVAGASWTSDAFNKALDIVRQEASVSR